MRELLWHLRFSVFDLFFCFWYWISNLWQSIECMANEVVFWTWSAETLNSLWCEMSICAKNLFNVGVCVNNSDDWLRLNYETSLRVFLLCTKCICCWERERKRVVFICFLWLQVFLRLWVSLIFYLSIAVVISNWIPLK